MQEIKDQLIWNNRRVKVDKKCVFYKTLFETGAIRVRDLFFDNNTLKPFQFWVDKGVKASLFLEWMTVIDAIPKEWRGLIRNSNFNDTHRIHSTELKLIIGDGKIALQTLKAKSIYNCFVKKHSITTYKQRASYLAISNSGRARMEKYILSTKFDKCESQNFGIPIQVVK